MILATALVALILNQEPLIDAASSIQAAFESCAAITTDPYVEPPFTKRVSHRWDKTQPAGPLITGRGVACLPSIYLTHSDRGFGRTLRVDSRCRGVARLPHADHDD